MDIRFSHLLLIRLKLFGTDVSKYIKKIGYSYFGYET